jgi:hypothetical protein
METIDTAIRMDARMDWQTTTRVLEAMFFFTCPALLIVS